MKYENLQKPKSYDVKFKDEFMWKASRKFPIVIVLMSMKAKVQRVVTIRESQISVYVLVNAICEDNAL